MSNVAFTLITGRALIHTENCFNIHCISLSVHREKSLLQLSNVILLSEHLTQIYSESAAGDQSSAVRGLSEA